MKTEIAIVKEKIATLRNLMERYDIFQEEDEVGLALKEVEDSFEINSFDDKLAKLLASGFISNRYMISNGKFAISYTQLDELTSEEFKNFVNSLNRTL